MSVTAVLIDILVMVLATIAFLVILAAFVRRILGAQVGIVRIIIAGFLGLGAEVGFESQFVWNQQSYTPALIPVQLGIIMLVAVAFLVVAELLVPAGSIPRPDEWIPSMRRRSQRTKRYAQITRIALRTGLLPFRPNTDPSSTGSAERRRQAVALREALEEAGGAFQARASAFNAQRRTAGGVPDGTLAAAATGACRGVGPDPDAARDRTRRTCRVVLRIVRGGAARRGIHRPGASRHPPERGGCRRQGATARHHPPHRARHRHPAAHRQAARVLDALGEGPRRG